MYSSVAIIQGFRTALYSDPNHNHLCNLKEQSGFNNKPGNLYSIYQSFLQRNQA